MLNPKDRNTKVDILQREAQTASEERQMEILSELAVRMVKEYQDPAYFTHLVSTTSKEEMLALVRGLLDTLTQLEVYEYCDAAKLLEGQVELFHSMVSSKKPKAKSKPKKRPDFVLKIQVPPKEWSIEGKFEISAWKGKYQVDEHICELFPEIEDNLGEIADLTEGSMEYWGDLSIKELEKEFIKMGFKTKLI